MLAFAGQVSMVERSQCATCRVNRSGDVALLPRRHIRRVLGVAGQPHDPAHGDANDIRRLVVGVRPRLPEAGDRGEDDVRLDLREPFIPEAEAVEIPRLEALDYNMCGCDELLN